MLLTVLVGSGDVIVVFVVKQPESRAAVSRASRAEQEGRRLKGQKKGR